MAKSILFAHLLAKVATFARTWGSASQRSRRMSESPPSVPEPAAPRTRRRWILGLLLTLLLSGGTFWWRQRLTPDEQLLVGRWEQYRTAPSGRVLDNAWVVHSDRTMYKGRIGVIYTNQNGRSVPVAPPPESGWRWSVRNGRFATVEDRSIETNITNWFQSGFKTWGDEPTRGRIEIVDPDTVKLTLTDPRTGRDNPLHTFEWRRIIEK